MPGPKKKSIIKVANFTIINEQKYTDIEALQLEWRTDWKVSIFKKVYY